MNPEEIGPYNRTDVTGIPNVNHQSYAVRPSAGAARATGIPAVDLCTMRFSDRLNDPATEPYCEISPLEIMLKYVCPGKDNTGTSTVVRFCVWQDAAALHDSLNKS